MAEYKDPWADASNQAVGALYKYYLSKPSQADMEAARLETMTKQSQLEKINIGNKSDQRLYDLGGWTGAPSSVQENLWTKNLGGTSDAAKRFEDIYVTKPMQIDTGDTKYIAGVNGPIAEYGVGVAPQTVVDKEGGRLISTPAIPATNRPSMPVRGEQGRQIVTAMAEQAGVNPALADGVFGAESSYGNDPRDSSAGATGPMQTMPGTLRDPGFGVTPAADPNDPMEQTRVGVEYLSAMVRRYEGDEEAALIAYNAGPDNADKWLAAGRDYAVLPDRAQTEPYVQKVLGAGQAPVQPQQPMQAGGQPAAPQQPMQAAPVMPAMATDAKAVPTNPMQPTTGPDGTVVTPLPMSPVAQQKQDERDRLKGISADLVNDETRRALNMLNEQGGAVSGMVGSMTKDIPMMPAHDFSKMLETIKANIGFDKLQSMRESSPTGGALGQVSTFENELLQAVFGSLAQSQTPQQLKYNLMRLQNTYNDIIHGAEGGPGRYEIPDPNSIQLMNSPEELQGVLEFFDYDPPLDIKDSVIQRANFLGM